MTRTVRAGDRYVALGSSFAVGPGLKPRAPKSPRLSGRSSVNGRPAQVDALSPTTDLITITAGGNDVGYLPTRTLSSLPKALRRLRRSEERIGVATDPETLNSRFEALHDKLGAVVREARDRSPAAQIILVDYLTILPRTTKGPLGALDATIVHWCRDCVGRLSETTRHVAAEEGCDFRAKSTASSERDAWAPEPWTRLFHLTLRGGAAYQPNRAGMHAVANHLAVLLTGEPERTS